MIDLNSTEIIYVVLGLGFLIAICWFIGRLGDPTYKVKRMRQILKSNTIMVSFISKDRKTIDKIAVNIDNARIKVGNTIVAVDKTKIYREDKPEAGFFIGKEHIKWDEGVPTLYIYADSLKPADFFSEPSNVSAEDVGTALISFVRIEIMKGLKLMEEYKIYFFVIGLVALIGAGMAYVAYSEAQQAHAVANLNGEKLDAIMNHFGIVLNQTTNSTTIIIKQSG